MDTDTTPPTRRRPRARRTFAALLALTTAAGIGHLTTTAPASADTRDASTFVPTDPCRLRDTRPTEPVGDRTTPLGPTETLTQQVTGTNGNCTIPAHATGVALNATIVFPTAASYLTLYPAGTTRPLASNLNWIADQPPTPNKVDVKLGPDGAIDVYNNAGSVHLVLDIVGYYTANPLPDLQQQVDELRRTTEQLSIALIDERGDEAIRTEIDELATAVADNATGIDELATATADNATEIDAVTAAVADNTTEIASRGQLLDHLNRTTSELDASQPFVRSREITPRNGAGTTPLGSVSIVAPRNGRVAVVGWVAHGISLEDADISCWLSDGVTDSPSARWTSPGGDIGDPPYGVSTFTGDFDVDRGENVNIVARCQTNAGTHFAGGNLVLLYTPD